jgi:hypothetical protein
VVGLRWSVDGRSGLSMDAEGGFPVGLPTVGAFGRLDHALSRPASVPQSMVGEYQV